MASVLRFRGKSQNWQVRKDAVLYSTVNRRTRALQTREYFFQSQAGKSGMCKKCGERKQ
jgi:hypothetical protein